MEKAECAICVETISVPITCPKCAYVACRPCTKKYLLSLQTVDPKCMACKAIWNLDFIFTNTDKEFYDKIYRNHRAKILFEREQSLLPDTQQIVEEDLKRDKAKVLAKKYSLKMKMKKAKLELFKMKRNRIKEKLADPDISKEEKRELKEQARELLASERRKTERIAAVKVLFQKAHRLTRNRPVTNGVKPEVKKAVFTARCPADNCNGYVMKRSCEEEEKEKEKEGRKKKKYSCGVCDTVVCKKCLEIKDDEHKCDPNTLETVKALKKETRNCPKCQTLIYKISGCDQMYCTQCHTPFSWTTGEVESGRIHNPHYYEYQRQVHGTVPREVGDVPRGPCGGPVSYNAVYSHLSSLNLSWDDLDIVHALIGHLRNICAVRFPINRPVDMNRDLRIKYLKNEITKDKFLAQLKMRDKKYEKNQVVNMVLTMFCDNVDTLLGNMLECKSKKEAKKMIAEVHELREYTNTVLRNAHARFKNMMPLIYEDFSMDRSYTFGQGVF